MVNIDYLSTVWRSGWRVKTVCLECLSFLLFHIFFLFVILSIFFFLSFFLSIFLSFCLCLALFFDNPLFQTSNIFISFPFYLEDARLSKCRKWIIYVPNFSKERLLGTQDLFNHIIFKIIFNMFLIPVSNPLRLFYILPSNLNPNCVKFYIRGQYFQTSSFFKKEARSVIEEAIFYPLLSNNGSSK